MRMIVKAAGMLGLFFLLVQPCTLHAQISTKSTPNIPSAQAPSAPGQSGGIPSVPGSVTGGVADYVLGVGDKIQMTVFGEDDLSGELIVSSTGSIAVPLIGEVSAAGQTVTQVQNTITRKLAEGYMRNPHVSLQVTSMRPFFIVGEVMKPGSYTYVNGMTVINAVALAGGYTYRADKDDIKIKHGGVNGREEKAEEGSAVVPGDVITISERFF